MKEWWEEFWWAHEQLNLTARLDAIGHILRLHSVQWRYEPDALCSGCIHCDTCNLLIWCRAGEWNSPHGRFFCRLIGHRSTALSPDGWFKDDENGVRTPAPAPDPPFCIRCGSEL